MSPKESVDLVIEPHWVLPIAPINTALADHAVAVTAGRIVAIAPITEVNARFEPRERIVRASHALLPGFVNAHTRAATTLLRGLPVYGPRQRWMRETVVPVTRDCMSPGFVFEGTLLAIAEMLQAGITTFADMQLFPEEVARAAAVARMRAAIGLPVMDGPTAWAENATEHLAKAEQLWDQYHSHPGISLYFAPQSDFGEDDRTLARVRRVADELDARVAMYLAPGELHETQPLGRSALARLEELGLLRPGFTAIHLSSLDEEDLETITRTGLCVVACQQAHLRLGGPLCPMAALAAREVNVGLGTDSPVAVGALDILAEARTAALLDGATALHGGEKASMEGVHRSGLAPETTLRMATLGGAAALGLSAEVGSIEVGKAADLVCIDLSTLACQPPRRPAEAVIFGATRQQVSDVWTSGRAAVREGRLLALDERELRVLARGWAERISAGFDARVARAGSRDDTPERG